MQRLISNSANHTVQNMNLHVARYPSFPRCHSSTNSTTLLQFRPCRRFRNWIRDHAKLFQSVSCEFSQTFSDIKFASTTKSMGRRRDYRASFTYTYSRNLHSCFFFYHTLLPTFLPLQKFYVRLEGTLNPGTQKCCRLLSKLSLSLFSSDRQQTQ